MVETVKAVKFQFAIFLKAMLHGSNIYGATDEQQLLHMLSLVSILYCAAAKGGHQVLWHKTVFPSEVLGKSTK